VEEKRRPCGNLMRDLEENILFSDIDSARLEILCRISFDFDSEVA
jgi:hypothetical protein